MIATQTAQAVHTKKELVFRNVLFATDFSSASNSALPYAVELARTFGAKLFALHVKEPINYALSPELWETAEAACGMEMDILRTRLAREGVGITTEILEDEGGLWPALAATVEIRKIDLIVLGTRGRTGIGKALLGSHAEEILRRTKCPVLTVGPHCEKGSKPTSILFATDFGPASTTAAPVAVALAEEYRAKLTLLHVLKNMRRGEIAVPEIFEESDIRKLRELVPDDAQLPSAAHYLVEEGEPMDKILEVAARTDAALIVLDVHQPKNVTGAATHLPIATVHHVVAHAACPVLTVHG
jgi:nucleotide-binding universal stress UspA family protein